MWIVYDGPQNERKRRRGRGLLPRQSQQPGRGGPSGNITVMATQLSAITMVGAIGQGYADWHAVRAILPGAWIAMIILSVHWCRSFIARASHCNTSTSKSDYA